MHGPRLSTVPSHLRIDRELARETTVFFLLTQHEKGPCQEPSTLQLNKELLEAAWFPLTWKSSSSWLLARSSVLALIIRQISLIISPFIWRYMGCPTIWAPFVGWLVGWLGEWPHYRVIQFVHSEGLPWTSGSAMLPSGGGLPSPPRRRLQCDIPGPVTRDSCGAEGARKYLCERARSWQG